jgi:hypothetical protein
VDEAVEQPDEEPIPAELREALAELEDWLLREPDEQLAEHALIPATRWALDDLPALDLERYSDEARDFVLATPIWDRGLRRFPRDVAYWMSQRLLVDERDEPQPEQARALLEQARAVIAERAELLEQQGFPRTARSFRALLNESAGGEPPADAIWNGLALRIAEPFLQDSANPVPFVTPSASRPPSEQPEPEPE